MRDLREIQGLYKDFDFDKEYKSRILKCKKTEFSRGGLMSVLGIYEPSVLDKQIVSNCNYGVKIKKPKEKPDFTYYFDESDKLILVEKKDFSVSFFIYSSTNTKVLTYEDIKTTPKIVVYFEYLFDDQSRLLYYLEVKNSYNREQYYSYDTFNMIKVKQKICTRFAHNYSETENHYILSDIEQTETYNLDDINILDLVEKSIKNKIFYSNKDNIKSINIILYYSNIEIDFDNSTKENDDSMIDYSMWNQNPVDLFSESDSKLFRFWLSKTNKTQCHLIEYKTLINTICRAINNLKKLGVIDSEVLILIHNLEYFDETIKIAKKINTKENYDRILNWYKTKKWFIFPHYTKCDEVFCLI